MIGIIILLVFVWASYLYIAGTYTYRTIKYARMPVHLRWELYPVPHEEGSEYGGSYLQDPEWWTKQRKKSFIKDVIFIIKDYLTFFQYFKLNKGYWSVLYMWHIGFYFVVAFHGLVALGAILEICGLHITDSGGSAVLYWLTIILGVAGFAFGCLGSMGVMIRRLTDSDLNLFATPKHFFSYIFYFFVFLSGLIAWAGFDFYMVEYREFYHAVFTLDGEAVLDAALVAHAVLFALFLFYMPSTQAMHYATKFISYFIVKWNDGPNVRGSKMEQKIQELLQQPVTWSAPHIQSGKSWAEVATTKVEPEVKK